jgi:hypothetical protein
MNRSPQGLQLSKALAGFLQHKAAEGLSPSTLCNYEHHLRIWLEYAGDIETGQVTAQDIRAFLVWLRPATIRSHVSHTLAKLEVASRMDAVVLAVRHGSPSER